MSWVFVIDADKRPLSPLHPGEARRLLTTHQAAVWHRYPFTIILKSTCPDAQPTPLRVKLDPGSKTTGIAVIHDGTGQVVWAAQIDHRGQQIKERLDQRRACRRCRRSRHTRYRQPRFANRRRRAGWLPPSLESRIANILTWVNRLRRWCRIEHISLELVKFDMQLMQNAEIRGIEYQQGELAGYETRQYLLEKFERRCAYCGKTEVALEVEHIVPKCRGGSNRVSNLTIACHACNQAKGDKSADEFGHAEVQLQAKAPLKDAAAVNASRWTLYHRLVAMGLPVLITAMGRHSRQMCRTNAYGFPDKAPKATSVVGGYRTGDMVKAVVPSTSRKAGVYIGRLAVRATGPCNLKTAAGIIQGIHIRYCQPLHRADGYTYTHLQQGAALRAG